MKNLYKKLSVIFILSVLFLVLVVVGLSTVSAAGNGSDNTIIQPTDKQFKAAKDPVYSSTNQTIYSSYSGTIKIFHYKAPSSGYFTFYTTGTLDTVGAVFEHNSFLFFSSWYDEVGYNDDSYYDYYTNRTNNFKIVVKLDKNEDYYVCVRGYGSNTGSFTLKIIPTLDKISSNTGGTWSNSKTIDSTYQKQYYTRQQVELAYQSLSNQATRNLIKNHYIDKGIVGTLNELNSMFGLTFSMVPMPTYVSAGLAITQSILQAIIDSVYANNSDIAEMLAGFEDKGNVCIETTYVNGHPATVYIASYGVVVSDSLYMYYIPTEYGGGYTIPITSKSFERYTSTLLKGISYEKGSWK